MKFIVLGVIQLVASAAAAPTASQAGTSPPAAANDLKPNIAISGCLMRQGYATFIVADAQVDAIGDEAERSAPSSGKRPDDSKTPPRWVLDNAGVVGQHVGEKVQVTGISEWVTRPNSADETSKEATGPGPSIPHIDVKAVKVLAKTCS